VGEQRELTWPGATKACHKLIDIFPGTTYILRAPSFRVDTMTPISANKVLIEFRGLGSESRHAGRARRTRALALTRCGVRSGSTCTRICGQTSSRRAR
jgi:hypothetical protein